MSLITFYPLYLWLANTCTLNQATISKVTDSDRQLFNVTLWKVNDLLCFFMLWILLFTTFRDINYQKTTHIHTLSCHFLMLWSRLLIWVTATQVQCLPSPTHYCKLFFFLFLLCSISLCPCCFFNRDIESHNAIDVLAFACLAFSMSPFRRSSTAFRGRWLKFMLSPHYTAFSFLCYIRGCDRAHLCWCDDKSQKPRKE